MPLGLILLSLVSPIFPFQVSSSFTLALISTTMAHPTFFDLISILPLFPVDFGHFVHSGYIWAVAALLPINIATSYSLHKQIIYYPHPDNS